MNNCTRTKTWTCPKCFDVFENGWVKIRHMRACDNDGASEIHETFERGDINLSHVMDGSFDNLLDDDMEVKVEVQEFELRSEPFSMDETETDGGMAADRLLGPQKDTLGFSGSHLIKQMKHKAGTITHKDLEILLFLQSTEDGNGTSQQQKQTILEYVRGFQTDRTNRLPKRVVTCFSRLHKVTTVL
jgi:hypothetical protein